MPDTIILFGSTSGNTERIAGQLAALIPGGADVFPVTGFPLEKLKNYRCILLGASTWGDGELQDDWAEALPALEKVDLSGRSVALFGLGDAEGYGETFVDGLGDLHAAASRTGARRIGFWETESYTFQASRGIVDGRFVGLVLDEDNQSRETEGRLRQWVEEILKA